MNLRIVIVVREHLVKHGSCNVQFSAMGYLELLLQWHDIVLFNLSKKKPWFRLDYKVRQAS